MTSVYAFCALKNLGLRARARITSHFGITSSHHLWPLLNLEILDAALLRLRFRSIVAAKSGANPRANSARLFLRAPLPRDCFFRTRQMPDFPSLVVISSSLPFRQSEGPWILGRCCAGAHGADLVKCGRVSLSHRGNSGRVAPGRRMCRGPSPAFWARPNGL
jgi:hypothetical protein